MALFTRILISTLIVVLANGWVSASRADDDAVYESLVDVQIGSVFFSPVERQRLDKMRKRKSASSTAASGKRNTGDAAGYIIGPSGAEQRYVDGDFVLGHGKDKLVFPGDVKFTRTSASAPPPDSRHNKKAAAESDNENE